MVADHVCQELRAAGVLRSGRVLTWSMMRSLVSMWGSARGVHGNAWLRCATVDATSFLPPSTRERWRCSIHADSGPKSALD